MQRPVTDQPSARTWSGPGLLLFGGAGGRGAYRRTA